MRCSSRAASCPGGLLGRPEDLGSRPPGDLHAPPPVPARRHGPLLHLPGAVRRHPLSLNPPEFGFRNYASLVANHVGLGEVRFKLRAKMGVEEPIGRAQEAAVLFDRVELLEGYSASLHVPVMRAPVCVPAGPLPGKCFGWRIFHDSFPSPRDHLLLGGQVRARRIVGPTTPVVKDDKTPPPQKSHQSQHHFFFLANLPPCPPSLSPGRYSSR